MFRIFIADGEEEMPDDPIMYVIAKQGIFMKKKVGLIESLAPVDKISILPDLQSYASIDIPRIPDWQFGQVIALFKDAFSEYHGEAIVILHYNAETEEYLIEVPEQEVSGGSADYKSEKAYDGFVRVGTIHSHGSMSAFHSGTDVNDEFDWDGLHITIGYLNHKLLSLSACIVANGSRFKINDLHNYVENLELVESKVGKVRVCGYSAGKYQLEEPRTELGYTVNGYEYGAEYPPDWFKNISKKVWGQGYFGLGRYAAGRGRNAMFRSSAQFPNAYVQGGLFDGLNTEIPDDDLAEWSPCDVCPHKESKSKHLLKLLLENLDDDTLDALGFNEVDDSLIQEGTLGDDDNPLFNDIHNLGLEGDDDDDKLPGGMS